MSGINISLILEVDQVELMKNRPQQDKSKLTGLAFGPSYQVQIHHPVLTLYYFCWTLLCLLLISLLLCLNNFLSLVLDTWLLDISVRLLVLAYYYAWTISLAC